jgi:hypothetical protein
MQQDELFRRLAVALAIGLLIGLERGWQLREEAEGERTAGLRTYALTGLLGGNCGALSNVSSPLLLAAALLSFAGALTLFSWFEATSENNFSVTGVVAALLTFVLGAYAVLGNTAVAVAAARVVRIGIESDRVTEERRAYVRCEQCPASFYLGEQAEALIQVATLAKARLVPEAAVSGYDGTKGVVWTIDGGRRPSVPHHHGLRPRNGTSRPGPAAHTPWRTLAPAH